MVVVDLGIRSLLCRPRGFPLALPGLEPSCPPHGHPAAATHAAATRPARDHDGVSPLPRPHASDGARAVRPLGARSAARGSRRHHHCQPPLADRRDAGPVPPAARHLHQQGGAVEQPAARRRYAAGRVYPERFHPCAHSGRHHDPASRRAAAGLPGRHPRDGLSDRPVQERLRNDGQGHGRLGADRLPGEQHELPPQGLDAAAQAGFPAHLPGATRAPVRGGG
jgi:hypothetical protein